MEGVFIIMFLFGLIVGSFLNVVIFRFGFSEHSRARSGCQSCNKPLRWFELIPVVSFFIQKGKCRGCGSSLSPQYPLVELATAILFVLTLWVSAPLFTIASWVAVGAFLLFVSAFVALLVYDIKHTLVPLPFAWALIGSALVIRLADAFSVGHALPLYDGIIGALVLGALFTFIVIVTKGKGMGVGDIYVAVALGLLFGVVEGVEVAMLAFWIGALVGTVLLVLKKNATMKTEVPFVPFLFIAFCVGMFTSFSPFALINALIATL